VQILNVLFYFQIEPAADQLTPLKDQMAFMKLLPNIQVRLKKRDILKFNLLCVFFKHYVANLLYCISYVLYYTDLLLSVDLLPNTLNSATMLWIFGKQTDVYVFYWKVTSAKILYLDNLLYTVNCSILPSIQFPMQFQMKVVLSSFASFIVMVQSGIFYARSFLLNFYQILLKKECSIEYLLWKSWC